MSCERRVLLLAVLQLLTPATPTFAQGCSPRGVIISEDKLAALSTCTTITGDLIVGQRDCSAVCNIANFNMLSSLQEIQGSIVIQCCNSLQDITGFNQLHNISGSLVVYYNRNLQRISGFGMLRNVTSVEISNNENLQTISGFSQLNLISGYLQIDRNTALMDLEGFSNLQVLGGETLVLGHALTVLYNTNLTTLAGLRRLNAINYGTVHIEGNPQLCYAGYPQWTVGSYPARPPKGDRGIDWRTKLNMSSVPVWQYSWNARGFPTLVVQNNANYTSCATASCHSSCLPEAGCLGPNDRTLCGTCPQSTDTCSIGPAPTPSSCDPTPIPWWPPTQLPYSAVFGVFFTFIAIVVLAVLVVLVIVGVKLYKRLKESRKGSFDINLSSSESGNSTEVELIPQGDYRSAKKISLTSKTTTSDMIAEPTPQGGGYSGKGMKKAPELDSVVISSYHQKPDSIPPPQSGTAQEKPPPTRTGKQAPTAPTSKQQMKPSKASPTVMDTHQQKTGVPPAADESTDSTPKDENSEIPMNFPRDQLKLLKEFGIGDFGKVHQAEAKKIVPGQKKTPVMVKQLKSGATREEREAFLRPVEAMKVLRHPNVLSLLGVCSEGPTLMVLLEYCAQGNFKTYLVRKRPEAATVKESGLMTRMITDMAKGLMYLHSMNIAHNDFAARSCLVMGDNTVKLGDYGLTRQIFKEDYYSRSPNQQGLPIRWMAPEQIVIQGRNSLKSMPASMAGNIWSFGIALWEVFSFAQWPYEDLSNEEVIQTLKSTGKCTLENPFRPREPLAPMFVIAQLCWQSAEERPLMEELFDKMQNFGRKKAQPGIVPLPSVKQRQDPRRQSGQLPESRRLSGQPQQSKRLSGQGYKPRRPAPKKPEGRVRTSSEEPLITNSSLSMEEEDMFSERSMSQDNTMSLKFPQKKEVAQKWERTSSADPLIPSSNSVPKNSVVKIDSAKPVDTILEEEGKDLELQASKPKYSFQDEEGDDIDGLGSSPMILDLGASQDTPEEDSQMDDSGGGGGDQDDFILEPPADFSQSSLDKETEEVKPKDQMMELVAGSDGNEVFFNFGAEEEEDEDSPLVTRKVTADSGPNFNQITERTKTGKSVDTKKIKRAGSKTKGKTNPAWLVEEDQFDQFDYRDALEEEDLPEVVYDEEVAALIW